MGIDGEEISEWEVEGFCLEEVAIVKRLITVRMTVWKWVERQCGGRGGGWEDNSIVVKKKPFAESEKRRGKKKRFNSFNCENDKKSAQ